MVLAALCVASPMPTTTAINAPHSAIAKRSNCVANVSLHRIELFKSSAKTLSLMLDYALWQSSNPPAATVDENAVATAAPSPSTATLLEDAAAMATSSTTTANVLEDPAAVIHSNSPTATDAEVATTTGDPFATSESTAVEALASTITTNSPEVLQTTHVPDTPTPAGTETTISTTTTA